MFHDADRDRWDVEHLPAGAADLLGVGQVVVLGGQERQINVELDSIGLDEYASLTAEARDQLEFALRAGKLSARGYQRVRAVALTIADLACAQRVERAHLAEALQLRSPLLETVFAEVGNGY